MDAETERQAEARKVLALYRAEAPVFVAARIGALVWADDRPGIDRLMRDVRVPDEAR